jgi:DNA polymerase III delta prime subunit
MDQNLYIYKFQPLYFKDFEIDENLIQILDTLVQMDGLNVLLIGDMGCGKTTLLNAIIREYYKNYSLKDYQSNILHINSLKEQGINYYRNDVKTFCQTCSSIKNKKKFVVLDDIDIINEQSQQVFRNCIDKYSHNVHFISSCSNNQKVIESLQSRFTIIRIKSLERENLLKILNRIRYSENIQIDDEAIPFILDVSNNAAKVLINYMEKFKLLNQRITLDMANLICTNINFKMFESYTTFILEKNIRDAITIFYYIYDKGYSVMDILDNYFLFVKTTNLLTEDQKYIIIPHICKYITIFHNTHEDEVELALFSNNLISQIYSKQ